MTEAMIIAVALLCQVDRPRYSSVHKHQAAQRACFFETVTELEKALLVEKKKEIIEVNKKRALSKGG